MRNSVGSRVTFRLPAFSYFATFAAKLAATVLWLCAVLPFATVVTASDAAQNGGGSASGGSAELSYPFDVQPLFARYCFECHGPDRQESGLRLDTGEFASHENSDGDDGSTAPLLEEMVRRLSADGDERMPPADAAWQPTEEERTLIERWVDQGGDWSGHWADQPVEAPAVPPPSFPELAKGPIDSFIQRQLAEHSLEPSSPAERERFARRLALVLTGLPPDQYVLDRYLNDDSPKATRRLTDYLLATPAYGEHIAAWWLDQARYADSNGFERDRPREMWHYRNWLISAINRDMPLDQFTIESLAGDLLPDPTPAQILATGFHRNSMIHDEAGVHEDEFKVRTIKDRLETTASVWLASTVGCAQCHDHKHDPISQKDYYELYAIFANTTDRTVSSDDMVFEQKNYDAIESFLGDEDEREHLKESIDSLNAELAADEELRENPEPFNVVPALLLFCMAMVGGVVAIFPRGRLLGLATLVIGVSAGSYAAVVNFKHREQPLASSVVEKKTAELETLEKELDALNRRYAVWTLVMKEGPKQDVHLQIGGDFLNLGEAVEPDVPDLYGLQPEVNSSGDVDRLQLAKWLVDPQHPRTSRVLGNRIWALAWGRPLVKTDRDFGYRGEQPTHPYLLDYLAGDLIHRGWSTKRLLREIVTSYSFAQTGRGESAVDARNTKTSQRSNTLVSTANAVSAEAAQGQTTSHQTDPTNAWYSRGPRYRMSAEMIRDVRLAAAGMLDRRFGNVVAYPHQPKEVWDMVFKGMDNVMMRDWPVIDGPIRYRRDVYTYVRRSATHPVREAFDAPNRRTCVTLRPRTMTAAQALVVLNEPACIESAAALAVRSFLPEEFSGGALSGDRERLSWLYRQLVGHTPSVAAVERLGQLLQETRTTYNNNPALAAAMVDTVPTILKHQAKKLDEVELASTIVICNTLSNIDAALTVN